MCGLANVHATAPVAAFQGNRSCPSSDPTYTFPFATAGEEKTVASVVAAHTSAPVEAFRSIDLEIVRPQSTLFPLATTGDEAIAKPRDETSTQWAPVEAFKA